MDFWEARFLSKYCSDGLTLSSVLNDPELLQEVMSGNPQLFEFFSRPEIVMELFMTVVDQGRFRDQETARHSSLCTDILSADSMDEEDQASRLSESIFNELPAVMPGFYSLLDETRPPDDLLVHFSKVNEAMLQRFPELMVQLLMRLPDTDRRIQSHLYSGVIRDLARRIWSVDRESELAAQWNDRGWTFWLIDRLGHGYSVEDHEVSLDVLGGMVQAWNEGVGEGVIRDLASPQAVSMYWAVLRAAGDGDRFSRVSTVVSVFQLFRRLIQSRPGDHLACLLDSLESNFEYFSDLLAAADEPGRVGAARLAAVEFLAELMSAPSSSGLVQKYVDADILGIVLDLFQQHPWSNFLHSAVVGLLRNLFQVVQREKEEWSPHLSLVVQLLVKNDLVGRIVCMASLNEANVERPKGFRLGYMGHVYQMTELLVGLIDHFQCRERSGDWGVVENAIQDKGSEWTDHVEKHWIQKRRQTGILGGGCRPRTEETEPSDYAGINSHSSGELQAYSDQLARFFCRQIASALPDQFAMLEIEDHGEEQTVAEE